MKKRIVSLALTAALAFSCLPAYALSAEPEHAPETQSASEATASEPVEESAVPAVTETAAETDTAPAEEHTFTYVALGDSITAGNGLPDFKYNPARIGVDASPNFEGYSPDCFVAKAADSLGLDRQHAINLGLPALMINDMLDLLRDGAMPHMNQPSGTYYVYPEYQEYVRNADVITIQIGSNDALVPFVVSIGNATNWKSEQFANSLLIGAFRSMSDDSFSLLFDSLGRLTLTSEESAALAYAVTDGMQECCNQGYYEVTTKLPQVIAAVRELNPDADIILMGYYNPAWMLPAWSDYFAKLNSYVQQLAESEGLTYVDINWTSTSNDMHPSTWGHTVIARKVVSAIKKQPSYERYNSAV